MAALVAIVVILGGATCFLLRKEIAAFNIFIGNRFFNEGLGDGERRFTEVATGIGGLVLVIGGFLILVL